MIGRAERPGLVSGPHLPDGPRPDTSTSERVFKRDGLPPAVIVLEDQTVLGLGSPDPGVGVVGGGESVMAGWLLVEEGSA